MLTLLKLMLLINALFPFPTKPTPFANSSKLEITTPFESVISYGSI